MSSPERRAPGACPEHADLLASLLGELTPRAREAVSRHATVCAECRLALRDMRDVVGALDEAAREPDAPPRGLASRVARQCASTLASQRDRATRRTRLAGLMAAAVLIFALSLHFALEGQHSTDSLLPRTFGQVASDHDASEAAGWLAGRVGADGRFDSSTWNGPAGAEVGMHSLALLALTEAGEQTDRSAVRRAARWLMERQDARGAIGAGARADADHAMATLALTEAACITSDARTTEAALAAINHLVDSQGADGGWQPRGPGRPGANGAQTAWAVAALMRAEELHWGDALGALAASRRHLAWGLTDKRGGEALDQAAVRHIALTDLGPSRAGGFGELYAAALSLLAVHATPN